MKNTSSPELTQEHLDLLMLFQAFKELGGDIFSRRLLVTGWILLQDPGLRSSMLGEPEKLLSKPGDGTMLSLLLMELEIDGLVEIIPSEHQQLWSLTPRAPVVPVTQQDTERLRQVLELLKRQLQVQPYLPPKGKL